MASLAFVAAAIAAAGDLDPTFSGALDPTFSGDGKQTTASFDGWSSARATVLQPDGKIVAVGTTSKSTGDEAFALARYNPDGSLDTTFSGDGKQTTDFGGGDAADGVAIQGDGKIVAVGRDGGSAGRDFALARYNPNGSLDSTFSGDGKQTTDFGRFDRAAAVVLQGNGRIVAVGAGNGNFALARYNPDGSLDATFSGDGKQMTDYGAGDEADGVAIQGDGKIVAVGAAGGSAGRDFALARYNPNGSLDATFSGDGKQTTDFLFGGADGAGDVAIQANGRIVAVGLAGGGATGDDFALARYNTNGTLDTSFSGDGRKRTNFGGSSTDKAHGVALQGDGRIVAVGSAGNTGDRDDSSHFALARYLGN